MRHSNKDKTSKKAHWWSVYTSDTVADNAPVSLNVMKTACWENYGRLADGSWTAIKVFFSFTVGSLVALWDVMTSKQSHDGLSLTFHPTTFPSYTLS